MSSRDSQIHIIEADLSEELNKLQDMHRIQAARSCEDLSITMDDIKTNEWFNSHIKKKECMHFVRRTYHPGSSTVCCCRNYKSQHKHENTSYTEADWNREKHIEEKPTDAFGDLTFQGLRNKTAKFVRASDKTSPKVLYEMMTDQWQLRKPNLVISVTGGAKEFKMNPRLKDLFSKGLIKAAQSTGAWIITGGCHAGVTKIVGEALQDFSRSGRSNDNNDIVTIGIAPWGGVHNRNSLIRKEWGRIAEYHVDVKNKGSPRCLDYNHSHFILVDDGRKRNYRARIPLRTELERFISKQSVEEGVDIKIPVVSVALAGGLRTLDNIHSSLTNKTPCVIVEGSGGVADLIAQVVDMRPSLITIALIKQKLHSIFKETFDKEIIAWTKKIQDIVRMSQLLTIFREDKGSAQYVDVAMALLKASQSMDYNNWAYQLKLALLWNRLDIAKRDIFNSQWIWKPEDLHPALTVALIENKPNFTQLFLDQGVRLRDYVKTETLTHLYENIQPTPTFCQKLKKIEKGQHENQEGINLLHIEEALKNLCKFPVPLYFTEKTQKEPDIKHQDNKCAILTSKRKRDCSDENPESELSVSEWTDSEEDREGDTPADSSSVDKPIHSASHPQTKSELNKSPSVTDSPPPSEIEYLIRDLLVWAVVQNRGELAEIIWTQCEDCVVGALACSMILRGLSKEEKDTDNVEEMEALANLFEERASGVFSECCRNNQLLAEQLLTQKSLVWGNTTCLQLATNAEAMSFMSNGGVQNYLNKIWWGKLSENNSLFLLLFCMAFSPLICTDFITFREYTDNAEDYSRQVCEDAQVKQDMTTDKSGSKRCKKSCTLSPLQRLLSFFTAPVVVFYCNVVSYIGFLWLFAYVLMVDFQTTPSWREYLLYVWIFSFLCEEVRQLSLDHEGKEFLTNCRMYLTDHWNQMDVVAIGLFIIGVVCRCLTASFYAARVILALDFILFCLRLMHIFTLSRILGPKIIMLRRMTKDIFFFLFLLAVWIVSFGVSKQAILVHNEQRLDWIFRSVIYESFLILFGHIPTDVDILNFDNSTCTSDGSDASWPKCVETLDGVPIFPEWLTIVLLCLYLLFAIILLLNLLIAMFSYTISDVQDKTDQIWKFQRHKLIKEYSNRPPVPPPFILLHHLYYLVINVVPKKQNSSEFGLLSWEEDMKEKYLLNQREGQSQSTNMKTRDISNTVDAAVKLSALEKHVTVLEQSLMQQKEQVFQSTVALNWIMKSLTEKELASKEKAPCMVHLNSIEAEDPTSGEKSVYSTSEHHVLSRQLMYPGSNVQRYPVPDEVVPWKVDFPSYKPPFYTAEKEGREIQKPTDRTEGDMTPIPEPSTEQKKYPRNPKGRTGITGLGSLMSYGPNPCLHLVLTRWKKNNNGAFVWKDSKKVLEVLAVKDEESECWDIPGGILRPGDTIPSKLKEILKEENWEHVEALQEKGFEGILRPGDTLPSKLKEILKKEYKEHFEALQEKGFEGTLLSGDTLPSKLKEILKEEYWKDFEDLQENVFEVYKGYLDDPRNTDDAWLVIMAVNVHFDSPVELALLESNLIHGKSPDSIIWHIVDQKIPLFANMKYILQKVARKLDAHY